MTKEAALFKFFSSLPKLAYNEDNGGYVEADDEDDAALPAYVNTAVPDDASLPYLTYTVLTGAFGEPACSLTVNIWCRTTDEAEPNAYARELGKLIPRGGVLVHCDGGGMRIYRGSPWCQSLADDTDRTIKRRYFNVSVEFITED